MAKKFGVRGGETHAQSTDRCVLLSCVRTYRMGIGYNTSVAMFGGTSPVMATAVVSKWGIHGLAWVLGAYGVVSLSAVALYPYLMAWKEKRKRGDGWLR